MSDYITWVTMKVKWNNVCKAQCLTHHKVLLRVYYKRNLIQEPKLDKFSLRVEPDHNSRFRSVLGTGIADIHGSSLQYLHISAAQLPLHVCASSYLTISFLVFLCFPFWLLKENIRLAQSCAIHPWHTGRTIRCLLWSDPLPWAQLVVRVELHAQSISTNPLSNARGEVTFLKRIMDESAL